MADELDIGAVLASAAITQKDLVAIADAQGRYVHLNPIAEALTGYSCDELVGRSVYELLHPDDLTTTTTGLSLLLDPIQGLSVNAAYVRMRCADGSWVRIETNGSLATAPDGSPLLVFLARPTTDPDLYEELIRLLTSGAPSPEAFALVPEFGRWRQPSLLYAVIHRDDDGAPTAVGSERLVKLAAIADLDDPTTPWATCADSGAEVVLALDELDPAFRAQAEAAGVIRFRCRPVRDPLHGDAAVVVLGQDATAHGDRTDDLVTMMDYLFDKMTMVLGLVLSWRQQVVELRRSALTDPLTGLANRTGFWAGFDQRSPATDHDVGLLYVDLDHFKSVNDTHGHPVGDALLVAVAERLAAVVRPGDLIARMGGDEFTVILHGASEAAATIADRIVTTLAEPFAIEGHTIHVGASVGVATTPLATFTPQDLLDAADRALYRAKQSGRGCWRAEPDG
jgi:diguanylate cyclase (GGDEF)-like protein/PAS domain S-box-containing protein